MLALRVEEEVAQLSPCGASKHGVSFLISWGWIDASRAAK